MTEEFKPFPDRDDVYDRSTAKPNHSRVWFREGSLSQAAEINEAFSISRRQIRDVGNIIASDGDRIEGGEVTIVNSATGTYALNSGRVYIAGTIYDLVGAVLTGVSTTGRAQIGVRLVSQVIDHEDDPDLLGLHPGTIAEGEPGAIRESVSAVWGWSGDGGVGDLFAIYTLQDGVPLDETPPPNTTGFSLQLAKYIDGVDGNFIDDGFYVTAVGRDGDGSQVFSVSAGVGYVSGLRYERGVASRLVVPESPDIEVIEAEFHKFIDVGGSSVIEVNHKPISGVANIAMETEFFEQRQRGAVVNTADTLSKTSVQKILQVSQNAGATVYIAGTDYALIGDSIMWLNGGNQPDGGETYDITYTYMNNVSADAVDDTSVTISGGVDDGLVSIRYSFKLPRVDLVCLNQDGTLVYREGTSLRTSPRPPTVPATMLALATVTNTWGEFPEVDNDGIRNITFAEFWRYIRRLVKNTDLLAIERMKNDISHREPTARHTVFVDPFKDDRWRDSGVAQDAAVFFGSVQLPIDPDIRQISLNDEQFLDYSEEILYEQPLVTGCLPINPYNIFPVPALRISISPGEDFWTEKKTVYLSDITRIFNNARTNRVVTFEEFVEETTEYLEFLREIEIDYHIEGMGPGETLDVLTFDGVDVNPGGLVGGANGTLDGSFTIPENATAGLKSVFAETGSGARARAIFEGRGVRITTALQRVREEHRKNPITRRGIEDREFERGGEPHGDPLAQTFTVVENRMILGVDVKFCEIGDRSKPVTCELALTDNGYPSSIVLAKAEMDMSAVVKGQWVQFRFDGPMFVPSNEEHCFIFKTADTEHALSIATLGEFDDTRQEWVTSQPYVVGVLFSSANGTAWTARQKSDMAMRVIGAKFSPLTKTVDLGTYAVTDMSDMLPIANISIPTNETSVRFRVTPEGEAPQILENEQNWERLSYFTGNVKVEAILKGSENVSPTLGRDLVAVFGSLRASATYVSRAFAMGANVDQRVRIGGRLPTGSSMSVEIDKGDNNWVSADFADSEAMPDGSIDYHYRKQNWDAPGGGRVRVTLTGTPAARPAGYELRAFSI